MSPWLDRFFPKLPAEVNEKLADMLAPTCVPFAIIWRLTIYPEPEPVGILNDSDTDSSDDG